MKKIIYLMIFSFLIVLSFVKADTADFLMPRTTYVPHETVQADVKFNVDLARSLSIADWKLISPNGATIPLALSMYKSNNLEYYLYFDVPDIVPGDYKFGIFNFYYNDQGLKKADFYTTLKIYNRTDNIISIKPGYVFSTVNDYDEAPFTLVVKNQGDGDVTVNIVEEGDFFEVNQTSFKVGKLGSKNVNIHTKLFNRKETEFSGKIIVKYYYNDYEIPFNIKRIFSNKETVKTNLTNITAEVPVIIEEHKESLLLGDLYGNPLISNELIIDINNNETVSGDFVVLNNGDSNSFNVSISVDENLQRFLQIQPAFIFELNPGDLYPILIKANFRKDINANYSGNINFKSAGGFSFKVPVKLAYNKPQAKTLDILNDESIKDYIPSTKQTNYTYIWVILGIVIILALVIIIYTYKKTKIKEDKFDKFVEKAKSRR